MSQLSCSYHERRRPDLRQTGYSHLLSRAYRSRLSLPPHRIFPLTLRIHPSLSSGCHNNRPLIHSIPWGTDWEKLQLMESLLFSKRNNCIVYSFLIYLLGQFLEYSWGQSHLKFVYLPKITDQKRNSTELLCDFNTSIEPDCSKHPRLHFVRRDCLRANAVRYPLNEKDTAVKII